MTNVNKESWEALTDEQRTILRDAEKAASSVAWDALTTRVSDNYEEMIANGITVVEPIPTDFLAALSTAGEQVYADWIMKVGETGQQILDNYWAARKN